MISIFVFFNLILVKPIPDHCCIKVFSDTTLKCQDKKPFYKSLISNKQSDGNTKNLKGFEIIM